MNKDDAYKSAVERSLRRKLGAAYVPTVAAASRLLRRLPRPLFVSLLTARVLAPTRARPKRKVLLGNYPDFICWAAGIERELNPPITSFAILPEIQKRMRVIQTMMRDVTGPYWKGDRALFLQEEYRDLIDLETLKKQQARIAKRISKKPLAATRNARRR